MSQELLGVQGLPANAEWARIMLVKPLNIEGQAQTNLAMMAGNSMHAAVVGAIIAIAALFVKADH